MRVVAFQLGTELQTTIRNEVLRCKQTQQSDLFPLYWMVLISAISRASRGQPWTLAREQEFTKRIDYRYPSAQIRPACPQYIS